MSQEHPTQQEAPRTGESEARRQQIRQELESRFRHCLRKGQICPLFHLMMRYRMEGQA